MIVRLSLRPISKTLGPVDEHFQRITGTSLLRLRLPDQEYNQVIEENKRATTGGASAFAR
jgi:hypothetical protein